MRARDGGPRIRGAPFEEGHPGPETVGGPGDVLARGARGDPGGRPGGAGWGRRRRHRRGGGGETEEQEAPSPEEKPRQLLLC